MISRANTDPPSELAVVSRDGAAMVGLMPVVDSAGRIIGYVYRDPAKGTPTIAKRRVWSRSGSAGAAKHAHLSAKRGVTRADASEPATSPTGSIDPVTKELVLDALRASGLLARIDDVPEANQTVAAVQAFEIDAARPDPVISLTSTPAPALRREAIVDFNSEADRLGIPLGTAPTDEEARERLRIVAADSTDIFATPELAFAYLTTQSLDSRDRTGVEILRHKGLTGVLAGLDHKRFGSRG